ncbi:hypothetical protein GCM10028784_07270 [Myceligenerans cantabricum]
MTVYTFTAAVDSLDLNDTAMLDALYSEDIEVYPSSIDGDVSVEFEVEAESGEEAVQRALDHFRRAVPGARVVRIDEDLVNATDISERLSFTREAVRLWATGARGDGFPRPRAITPGGNRLWTWASVYAWAESTGKELPDEPCPVDDACIDWFNGQLANHPLLFVYIPVAGRNVNTSPSPFVTERQHGIAFKWDYSDSTHLDPDEFQGRDGARWICDGSTILKTARKSKF